MSYDPNAGDRFTYLGYDGQMHTREWPPDQARWRAYLQNKLRLAELERRANNSALNEPEFKPEPEVRDV